MSGVLTEIISLLVAGISGIATGIGQGLTSLVQNIFLVEGAEGVMELSTFGGLIVVFAGNDLPGSAVTQNVETRKKTGRLEC